MGICNFSSLLSSPLFSWGGLVVVVRCMICVLFGFECGLGCWSWVLCTDMGRGVAYIMVWSTILFFNRRRRGLLDHLIRLFR